MLFTEGFDLLLFFGGGGDKSGVYFCLRRDFESVVLSQVVEVQLSPEKETRPQGQPSHLLPPLIKFRATVISHCSASTY